MKILITGGAGFVGSNLAKYLSDKGHHVVVFDNFQRGNGNLPLLKNCVVKKGELDDAAEFISQNKFDIIYHFAAQVAVTKSYESPKSDFRINAAGTFNLLQAARDTPVIYASTNKVYGENVNTIPIEEFPTRYDFSGDFKEVGIPERFSLDSKKHTPYGCSKLVGDIYVREHGGVVNRFSCMYGTHQFGDEDQGWVAHFVISKVLGLPIKVYGDGKQVRDILFVEDVIRLLEIQAEKINEIRGEVFNIGGGYANTISILELCKELNIEPSFDEWRPSDQKVYYSDIRKAKHVLGWKPKISIKEGIERLQNWVSENKSVIKSIRNV